MLNSELDILRQGLEGELGSFYEWAFEPFMLKILNIYRCL